MILDVVCVFHGLVTGVGFEGQVAGNVIVQAMGKVHTDIVPVILKRKMIIRTKE